MAPRTAYMLFCNANRETVRQKLLAEGHEKVAVTVVAKELGQLWKALSDEEKAAYKAQADEQQQQQQDGGGDAQQDADGAEKQPAEDSAGTDPKAAALPVAWVRRVVVLDSEVKRCSGDALLALSGAADVFLAAVCAKATAAATGAKRRTVRLDDIERCVRGDKRLSATGFMAVMSMVAAAAASEDGKTAPPGKKARLDKVVPGKANNSIERAFGLAQSGQS